jgi:hypothetical protein
MPTIEINDATKKLATAVEHAEPDLLGEFYAELFPESPLPGTLTLNDFAKHVRTKLVPEEIVDLWNVVFPHDHHVWYNEETNEVHYNEELAEYMD